MAQSAGPEFKPNHLKKKKRKKETFTIAIVKQLLMRQLYRIGRRLFVSAGDGAGDGARSLAHVRQALYHQDTPPTASDT
jgi:hypothetical protein